MPSLKDFIEALSVSWPIALVALIGSGGTLGANYYNLPYADLIGPAFLAAALIIFLFAVGICFVKVILVVIDCIASVRSWFATRAHIARHIKLLYDLPDQEHAIMAYLLKRNTQSFPYPYGEGRLVGLLSKGLISRPGGQHQQLSWPHYIPDHVWAEMKANTDKFVLVPPNANPL